MSTPHDTEIDPATVEHLTAENRRYHAIIETLGGELLDAQALAQRLTDERDFWKQQACQADPAQHLSNVTSGW